ncbi:hypothetical protein GNI_016590 [Gregarina niphandrodes]|uniref:Uncharacterized protein n=1 Tax=Gregarina niphandrodes TaxID=110365 RepID=A0A023BCI8_GRENI|nr:hypothetical protein GNI_016590 [Gregarina niphandrodes]EZG82434.1 hypothetical protein GNI_016590 [Gregarina niphandrodes]|eukprot:XP_011129003.1 hypothetical protein GNI_016590 [Gregarina niphandrodes]
MRCLRNVNALSGATREALARVIMTFEVNGKYADLVETFGSAGLWNEASKTLDEFDELVVDGCGILMDMPDMVVGLKNVDHVQLSTEELEELHAAFGRRREFRAHVLVALGDCLCAFAEVARQHPDAMPEAMRDRVRAFANALDSHGLGDLPKAALSSEHATRVEDQKFVLRRLVRCPVEAEKHVKTCSVPTYVASASEMILDEWTKAEAILSNPVPQGSVCVAEKMNNTWVANEVIWLEGDVTVRAKHPVL